MVLRLPRKNDHPRQSVKQEQNPVSDRASENLNRQEYETRKEQLYHHSNCEIFEEHADFRLLHGFSPPYLSRSFRLWMRSPIQKPRTAPVSAKPITRPQSTLIPFNPRIIPTEEQNSVQTRIFFVCRDKASADLFLLGDGSHRSLFHLHSYPASV